MFQNLTQRFEQTWSKILGKQLTAKNIQETLAEVRTALLDADVALPVVDTLLAAIQEKAIGQTTLNTLTPAHTLLKIINDEFVTILGSEHSDLMLGKAHPAVVLIAGLQGSGKTTSVAKLARFLTAEEKKSVLVVSTDIYRPSAIEQLQVALQDSGAQFFPAQLQQKPLDIVKAASAYAKSHYVDVILVDTAGRLHVDQAMMDEIKSLHTFLQPQETLYVLDSMAGQDAAKSAQAFHDLLNITGIILTKVDGDARGGAALSVRYLTNAPIKFMGVGEKISALERFYPNRIAQRILGQGDLAGLLEETKKHVAKSSDLEKMAGKLKKGQLDLNDFVKQIDQLQAMGGMSSLLNKLPGMSQYSQLLEQQGGFAPMKRMKAIIQSMTPQERRNLDLMVPPNKNLLPKVMKQARSRVDRVAKGSGVDAIEVKRVLKQFSESQRMMSKMQKGGMMQQLASRMPGQFPMSGMGGLGDLFKGKE